MSLLHLPPDYLSVCALGLGGTLLALAGLLLSGRRWWAWASPWAALALAAAGAVGTARVERAYWLPPLALGAVWGLFLFLRGPAPVWLGRLARAPRLQWALLLVASPALMFWQGDRLAEESSPLYVPPPDLLAQVEYTLVEVPAHATTDAGNSLPLFAPDADPEQATHLDEEAFLRKQSFKQGVVRTAGPTLAYNCHGWVFAAGRHWLRGRQVEQVLRDNDYRPVSEPRPGDVAVYRDDTGAVIHSGLVRTATPDGLVLVESKWGGRGRYVHPPDEHCYGAAACTYYRSPRRGHLLALDEGSPSHPTPPPVLGGG